MQSVSDQIGNAEMRIIGVILMVGKSGGWRWLGALLFCFPVMLDFVDAFIEHWRADNALAKKAAK